MFSASRSCAIGCALAALACGAGTTGRTSGPQACLTQTAIASLRASEHANDERRFEDASRALGLVPVSPKQHVWQVGYGGTAPVGTFEDRDETGAQVHLLMMGTASEQCGPPAPHDLARDRGGTIYLVIRDPEPIAPRSVVACDCPDLTVSCGGMPAPPVAVAYEVPAGTRYGGTITVGYQVDDTMVRTPTACPAPPQPP